VKQLNLFEDFLGGEPARFKDVKAYAKYWVDRQLRLYGKNTNTVEGLATFLSDKPHIKMGLDPETGWFQTKRI